MNASAGFSDREIAAWVRGTLAEARRDALELAMLEDQALFDRVQHEALLCNGLIGTDLDAGPSTAQRWFGRFGLIASAAFAVCALGFGVLAWDLYRQLDIQANPATGVPVVTLLEQRAILPGMDGADPRAAIPGPALIEADVSLSGGEAFDLELEFVDQRRFQRRVRPDARGFVTALVPPGRTLTGIVVRDARGQVLIERHFAGSGD